MGPSLAHVNAPLLIASYQKGHIKMSQIIMFKIFLTKKFSSPVVGDFFFFFNTKSYNYIPQ